MSGSGASAIGLYDEVLSVTVSVVYSLVWDVLSSVSEFLTVSTLIVPGLGVLLLFSSEL